MGNKRFNNVLGIEKIDDLAVNGLTGVEDSLAYLTSVNVNHHHSLERWFGISGDQSGNDWADDTLTPFVAISGANTYGGDANDEAKVFGTDDLPVGVGKVKVDIHRLFVVNVDHDTPYKLRIIWGTGTMADAITAGQYSEVLVMSDVTNPQRSSGTPVELLMERLNSGTDKVWIQAWNATDNSEIDFLVGIHEYTG